MNGRALLAMELAVSAVATIWIVARELPPPEDNLPAITLVTAVSWSVPTEANRCSRPATRS